MIVVFSVYLLRLQKKRRHHRKMQKRNLREHSLEKVKGLPGLRENQCQIKPQVYKSNQQISHQQSFRKRKRRQLGMWSLVCVKEVLNQLVSLLVRARYCNGNFSYNVAKCILVSSQQLCCLLTSFVPHFFQTLPSSLVQGHVSIGW